MYANSDFFSFTCQLDKLNVAFKRPTSRHFNLVPRIISMPYYFLVNYTPIIILITKIINFVLNMQFGSWRTRKPSLHQIWALCTWHSASLTGYFVNPRSWAVLHYSWIWLSVLIVPTTKLNRSPTITYRLLLKTIESIWPKKDPTDWHLQKFD